MLKHTTLFFFLALILAACNVNPQAIDRSTSLSITNGEVEKSYHLTDLEALPASVAAVDEVNYVGVALPVLLEETGFMPQNVKTVTAIGAGGYRVAYDASVFQSQEILVSYARQDGALSADDGHFRMVLPGEGGQLNLRQLVALQVIE